MRVEGLRVGRFASALLFLFTGFLPRAVRGDISGLYGKTVVSIAYSCDGPVERTDVERLVAVQAGRPLSEADTAETVRNLFATRQFSDVQVEASAAEGGVAVRILLLRSFRVDPLRFTGRRGISRDELRRALPFFAGSVYSAADVEEGADAIARRLVAEGFPRVAVRSETAFDRRRFDASVIYRIDAGERARVAPAIFLGALEPYTAEQLLEHAGLKTGHRYREAKALQDATRIREFLHGKGRLKAQIELIAAQPTEDGRISPVYRASVGPRVVFDARGVKAKRVRNDVHDLLEGQVFDEDLVLQYVEREHRDLQRKGYYRSSVTYALDEKPDQVTVTVDADRGPRYAVERIDFEGNASVPVRTLRRLMVTTTKGLPLVRPGRLTDEDLKGDVDAVLGWYQAQGWVSARVGPAEVKDGSKPDRLVVRIPIEEGPRTLVASRSLLGAEHADMAAIEKLLAVRVGQPFNPNVLRADLSAIQGYYQDRGWLEASVRDEYRLSSDRASVEVTYRIVEGLRSFFGKTIVRGNTSTRTERIRRLTSWTEGAPFSEERILEAQRRLSRTGAFRRVEVHPQPADPADRERNVQVDLQEARPLSLLYGFGYQYVPDAAENRHDPFVVGGVTTHNLFGGMRTAGLEGQIALSGRYRVQVSLRDPFLIGDDYPLTSVVFAARETIQKINLDRLGFVNEVSHTYGNHLRASLRAEYQRIRPTNPEDLSSIEISQFPRADQPIEEATIGPAFFYDRRDDVIDPHRGYYVSVAGKYAFPLFTAEARYTKFATQATYFQPFGRAVLAVSGRFGGIFPYGPSDIQVPIAERFFVGGRSTGRAFGTDLLGVAGSTVDYDTKATLRNPPDGKGSCAPAYPTLPNSDCSAGPFIVGGNGFVALSAELRIPIAGNLGAVAFYDAAQVWANFSQINLRFEGADGLRQGAGAGLFYMLPIGPLRAEYAWKFTRRTIPFTVVDVSVPENNPTGIRSQTRESPGQFFISIGFPF